MMKMKGSKILTSDETGPNRSGFNIVVEISRSMKFQITNRIRKKPIGHLLCNAT